jgi:Fe2+ transport system protein FeoA
MEKRTKTTRIQKTYTDKRTGEKKVLDIDYAKVADRIKIFREENPNGSIETVPTLLDGGQMFFKATIIKDLNDQNSARATGNSMGTVSNDKGFEKQETLAVGRALAFLGYLAGGEIASSEEMEEFHSFQEKKKEGVNAIVKMLEACKTVDELKEKFLACGMLADADVIATKNATYKRLTNVPVAPEKVAVQEPTTAPSGIKKKAPTKKDVKVEEGEVDPSLLPLDLN